MQSKPEQVLGAAYAAVMTQFEKCLNVEGATPNVWRVIETLDESPGLTLKELSQQTDIKISALSKLIDRLVKNAWVHRKQSSSDRRSIQLFISEHGRETFSQCLPQVRAFRNSLTDLLDSHTHLVLEKLENIAAKPTSASQAASDKQR